MIEKELIHQLNAPEKTLRLDAIKGLKTLVDNGQIPYPEQSRDVNNHVHTTYSFSPYSPTKAVWMGFIAGLRTIGIMDHDTVCGAEEFIEAAKIVGIAATVGVETRVKMDKTPLSGKTINNPDQDSIAYVAIHGIPHTQLSIFREYFKPYNRKRNERNRKMVDNINKIVSDFGISIDFDKDVIPISMYHDGGSITERHLLYALILKILDKYPKGEKLLNFVQNDMGIKITDKIKNYLLDENNPYYEYDLLGALKSSMVSRFYIDADEECPDVFEFMDLAHRTNSILAYAYLGDITQSVTGDKKAQKFEDDYIEKLFDILKDIGFRAVTYMPSRNQIIQLREIRARCEKDQFFQISGEDINTPRQNFICMAQRDPEFDNLYDAAWALIGHETAATKDLDNALFSDKIMKKIPKLNDRIEYFKKIVLKEKK